MGKIALDEKEKGKKNHFPSNWPWNYSFTTISFIVTNNDMPTNIGGYGDMFGRNLEFMWIRTSVEFALEN